ncbi:hypothetical protein ACJJTC_016776 [Scirpophaga incertulas]
MTSQEEKDIIKDFIDLYRDLTCLWDVSSEDYKDTSQRKTAWGILAEKLKDLDPNANELSAKKKVDHLKYSYHREIKKSKVKALTKEETKMLVALVQGSKVINNKTTNATSNKLKNEEWISITEKFNSCGSSCPRTANQLRMKWENLKKNARRRSTMIRMNQLKTGGGTPEYIPPDDILDTVSSLLGSTVEGFTVEFGGDAEMNVSISNDNPKVQLPDVDKLLPETPTVSNEDWRRKKMMMVEGRETWQWLHIMHQKKTYLDANVENIYLQNEKLKLEIAALKNNISNSSEILQTSTQVEECAQPYAKIDKYTHNCKQDA